MGDYNRSTTESNFANISPDILQAVQKYIPLHNLGDNLNRVKHCIVSTSEKSTVFFTVWLKRGFINIVILEVVFRFVKKKTYQ